MRGPDRRTVLSVLAAGALVAAGVEAQGAQMTIRGHVTYAGGKAIPAGTLKVRLEDPRVKNKARRRLAEVRIRSSGDSRSIPFELSAPAARLETAADLELVARLEREDGWLLARASGRYKAGQPATLTLNVVMY